MRNFSTTLFRQCRNVRREKHIDLCVGLNKGRLVSTMFRLSRNNRSKDKIFPVFEVDEKNEGGCKYHRLTT